MDDDGQVPHRRESGSKRREVIEQSEKCLRRRSHRYLYKTPDVDLSEPNVPHRSNPEELVLDVWLDGQKRMSLQWEAAAEKEILLFKPDGCEKEAAQEIRSSSISCNLTSRNGRDYT
jgi:hypothetical protein